MSLTEKEKKVRSRLRGDFAHYAQRCLKIRTKDGAVEPLHLNTAQQHIHERIEAQRADTGKVRAIILKGRQQGCSTYVEGRLYWRVTHRKGVRAFILTHEREATDNLFEMVERYHLNCPVLVQPHVGTSSAKELVFDRLDSGYKVGTAGNKAVGRSQTIQYFHGSEVAFWPNAAEHAKGIMQAIPDEPDTESMLESTANGMGNYFHEQWQLAESGQSDYIAVFVPWYWQPEYQRPVPEDFRLSPDEVEYQELYGLTDEQMAWRRSKIVELSANGTDGETAFKQEYPATPTEAFQYTGEDSLILPEVVMRSRHGEAEAYGPKLVGVDPARFGNDNSSIIRRQGRVAYDKESHAKWDTMQLAGRIAVIIREEMPDHVFIDIGGLGAGVYDRLVEMGYSDMVTPVNGGSKPMEAEKYYNKRAEMWGEMANWLKEEPNQIPDDNTLQADLCGPTYKWDSNSRLVLEKKEDMKKRGLRSPDDGDALALTFAFPVSPEIEHDWGDDWSDEGRNEVGGY